MIIMYNVYNIYNLLSTKFSCRRLGVKQPQFKLLNCIISDIHCIIIVGPRANFVILIILLYTLNQFLTRQSWDFRGYCHKLSFLKKVSYYTFWTMLNTFRKNYFFDFKKNFDPLKKNRSKIFLNFFQKIMVLCILDDY